MAKKERTPSQILRNVKRRMQRKVDRCRKTLAERPENIELVWGSNSKSKLYHCPYCNEYRASTDWTSECPACPLSGEEGPCKKSLRMFRKGTIEWQAVLDYVEEQNKLVKPVKPKKQ